MTSTALTAATPSLDDLVSVVRADADAMQLSIGTARLRVAGLRLLLGLLESMPGDSWQTRWEASGFDHATDWPTAAGAVNHYQRAALNSAVGSLMCHRVLRPSYGWLLRLPVSASVKEQLRATTDRVDIDRLADAAAEGGVPKRMVEFAIAPLTRVLIHTGKTMSEPTTADLLGYADACRAHGRATVPGLQTAHQLLRQLGIVDDPGLLSRYTLRRRNKYTVADMVDRHRIVCRPVRDLLVRYLSERQTALDYSSLRGLASRLAGTFWADLERHHPGIDSIRLTPETARAWQERLWTLPDGRPRGDVHGVLIMVRSFYLDIAHWAAEDPATWGQWVAPPPVSEGDLRPFAKVKHHNRARMHARTRTLAPALPRLVASAHRRLTDATALLRTAQATDHGQEFECAGRRYWRLPVPKRDISTGTASPVRVVCLGDPAAKPINCRKLEEDAFWAWAIIEVLRLIGIRSEELLELNHLSIRHYTMADGQLVVLLQIAPSKTDRERVLPVCPELAHALARIVSRIRGGGEQVPLVARYDYLEHEFAAPQPLLFQWLQSGTPSAMSRTFVSRRLAQAATHADLRDVDGRRLAFTPHDFRRVFATDAVNGGLPVHIAAKLLGHLSLSTTQGYVAVYPEQVIRHVQAHIVRRRAARPAEEYRDPTDAEWAEFEQHFRRRKLALGDCYRPYGSDCPHEHACFSELLVGLVTCEKYCLRSFLFRGEQHVSLDLESGITQPGRHEIRLPTVDMDIHRVTAIALGLQLRLGADVEQ